MGAAELLAVAALLAGGLVQSATGFGFALVAAPVLAALYPPREAVPTLALVGILVSVLMLAGEGRRPRPLAATAAGLIAASLPGTVLGVAVLTVAAPGLLRGLVAVAVLGAVAARAARRGRVARSGRIETAVAGVLAGALGATTGLNGPPLVLLMLRRAVDPERSRDTLTACFVVFDGLVLASLAAAGALHPIGATPLLLAAAAAGQLAGRRVRRLAAAHHEAVSLTVLGLSGVVALASALGVLPAPAG